MLLVLLLAAPLHRYLAARSAVQQADQQRRQGDAQLAQLQQQDKQLSDPAYIEQQARVRLQYALPGDTVYVVVGPGQRNSLAQPTTPSASSSRAPGQTWNQRLWGSVQAADHGS